jgi:hypothetical protein
VENVTEGPNEPHNDSFLTHPTAPPRVPKRRRQALFLQHLAAGHPVAEAARLAGVSRNAVYEWRKLSEAFSRQWEAAYAEGGDMVEAEARRRGVEGWLEPVYQGGEQVGSIRRYSDRLLALVLRGRKPDQFGDRLALSGSVRTGEPEPVTVRVVYTKRLANGEHLPDMSAAEWADFRRWRYERDLARRVVPLPEPKSDGAEPVRD